jgi:hypothetical protein
MRGEEVLEEAHRKPPPFSRSIRKGRSAVSSPTALAMVLSFTWIALLLPNDRTILL